MSVRFELFVEDLKKSVDFYTNILGFKIAYSDESYSSVKRDTVTIGICYARDLHEGHYFRPEIDIQRKGLGVEIVLEVDNVEEEYKKVQSSGYPITEELQEQDWNLIDFRIVDPDGYYLRITSRK
jgi:lactoylglutathione lyase